MPSKTPFDIIIITSPDYPSSLAVRELIVSSCGQFPSDYLASQDDETTVLYSDCGTVFVSTCDPFGARMGSGGGTIAALAEAHQLCQQKKQNPTILICHAGGESTRCPTQITLGKAWTSLPVLCHHDINEFGATYSTKVSNPTSLLIEALGSLFENVPRGSVVVAASDVLLQFDNVNDCGEKKVIDFSFVNEESSNCVIGLAVPAPLSTAKNHGVFVIDSNDDDGGGSNDIHPTYQVLQKPTVDEMKEMRSPSCVFHREDASSTHTELHAWIDTGVITFLPNSAAILKEVSTSTLKACTRSGLQQMYDESDDNKFADIEAFAKRSAPKICLYSDILHSLQTTVSRTKQHIHIGDELMDSLHNSISKLQLLTCTISSGAFIHLGTTRELLDFLSLGACTEQASTIASFGRSIGLTSRALTSLYCFEVGNTQSSVVLNTRINGSSSNNNSIGRGSVLEHCLIEGSNSSAPVKIGERCLISGIRPNIKHSLCVPSGTCLQLLPLQSTSSYVPQSKNAFVCICFGVDDDIKASPPSTLFGIDFNTILERSGITRSDLWDGVDKPMIWNAKLMPILVEDEEMKLDLSLLDWIAASIDGLRVISDNTPDESSHRIRRWKESKRISLSELRQHVDSSGELLHRKAIMSCGLPSNYDNLLPITERRNEPCNLNHIIDLVANTCSTRGIDPFQLSELRSILNELESVIWRSAETGHFDTVGRCFMTMSLLLSDIAAYLPEAQGENLAAQNEDRILATLAGSFWNDSIKTKLLSIKDGQIGPYNLIRNIILNCCCFLEKAASVMTGRCVRGNIPSRHLEPDAEPISIGTAVVASAPVRIDLSGGWSDTPPVSYEHGGAVANLAVTVDDQRPLGAKCRLVKGMDGILLRTESRALSSNELISSTEVRILQLNDMKDYNNPHGECSLLKCALIYLGLVTIEDIDRFPSRSIQPYVDKFCQRNKLNVEAGLEVVSTSHLPTGSGMGGSSILGGCVVAAIARCIGITLQNDNLVEAVLMLENMMTTGGGWQDQIGGLFGGLKLGTSDADSLLKTTIRSIDLKDSVREELNDRLVLVFSGKQRLAKNILNNVLRRWARRSSDIIETVQQLVQGAHESIECLEKGDLDRLGSCMSTYWEQKKVMAGTESGAEPVFVKSLLDLLRSRDCIVGGTLCGAGGGGFLALLLARGKRVEDLKDVVAKDEAEAYRSLSWHSCSVDQIGLSIELVEE